ncbi:MAG: aromatic aminobenezylarsenical efflux permease ArsG family transporter [archaeon]
MTLMTFMEAMGTSEIAIIAAFFIGLMTALSPCPMATNITAIAAISKRLGEKRWTLLAGVVYTTGRALTYVSIASLIVWAGLSSQSVSLFLQRYGEAALGPFLILIGVLMTGLIKLPNLRGSESINLLKEKLFSKGLLGCFLLGVIFAMAFCPFSAVLFFGMLIPLALATGDGVLIPILFALGTGLPVIIVSFVLTYSVSKLAVIMDKVQVFDKWMRRIVSVVFIFVGVYYTLLINI